MYTEVGRILSKKEAKHAFDTISTARENRELVNMMLQYSNPSTNAVIRVYWERAKVGLGDWESLSIAYTSFDEKVRDEELFDNVLSFATAYLRK